MIGSRLGKLVCVLAGALALGGLVGCGGGTTSPIDSGPGGTDSAPGPSCGDGTCAQDEFENCTTCLSDCGPCMPGCGDGVCAMATGENCTMCPSDCGACPPCGDAVCAVNEDCDVCAADCGMCTACGDAQCDQTIGEDCSSCSADCGTCAVCGNGACELGENCSTCTADCTCVSCMNGTCDPLAGETCASCASDCTCGTSTCQDALACAMACADMVCLQGCYDDVCSAAQMQLQEILVCVQANCFAACATDPGGIGCISCVASDCSAEFMACGSTC